MQIGTKYDSSRDVADIAKLVRKELRGAFGTAWKFSVKIRRFSMGQAIDVEIKATPCCLWTAKPRPVGAVSDQLPELSPAGRKAIETVEGILDSYNRQDIDLMTDYFNVDFYSHVQVATELRQRQFAALERQDA